MQAVVDNYHVRFFDFYAAGDFLAAEGMVCGTHKGGMFGAPGKGQKLKIGCINLYRFEGERLSNMWFIWDPLGAFRSLGILLAPPE